MSYKERRKVEPELIVEFSPIGFPISVTFFIEGQEVIFIPSRKIINGSEIRKVKKTSKEWIDDEIYKVVYGQALNLLIKDPPDASWLKCFHCSIIPSNIFELLKAKRLKDIIGRIIQCSNCNHFYKIPPPPASSKFEKYKLL
jgi:hypothetical protein